MRLAEYAQEMRLPPGTAALLGGDVIAEIDRLKWLGMDGTADNIGR
jgi:hypothetical protein